MLIEASTFANMMGIILTNTLGMTIFTMTLNIKSRDTLSYVLLKSNLRKLTSCLDSSAHLSVSFVRRILSKTYLRRRKAV